MIIDENIDIPKGSKAILFSADLLGEMNVKLLFEENTPNFHQDECH
ncbi:MAG: hypothetical protein R2772_03995 [Chitinophagales bacterium]